MARRPTPWLALAACLLVAACAPGARYTLRVEAYSYMTTVGKTFVVLPGVMDTRPNAPEFTAVAEPIAKLLTDKGYTRAPDVDHADIGVYLLFDLPKRKNPDGGLFSRDDSGAGQTGTAAGENALSPPPGTDLRDQAGALAPDAVNRDGSTASLPGADSQVAMGFVPGQGFAFAKPSDKTLEIEAVDLARYKAGDPKYVLWRVKVVCLRTAESLPKMMPAIVAGLSDYIGKSGYTHLEVNDRYEVKPVKPPKQHFPD